MTAPTRATRPDEAAGDGRVVFFPHRLTVLGPPERFAPTLSVRRLGAVTVGLAGYGTDVALSFGPPPDGYQVVVPLSGRVEARNGVRRIVTRPGRAGVYAPGDTTVDLLTGDCLLLAVRLERQPLEQELENLLDRPLRRPVVLASTVDLTRGAGRDWMELVQTVRPQPGRRNDLLDQPSIAERLGAALITGLLLAACPEGARPTGPTGPGPVRRALETIEDRYPEALTVDDLAAAGRISVRRLQAGFRRHVGMSPMSYLRGFRLDRAHELLCRARPDTTSVTEVAMTCGLRHLGRFAAEYHHRYGETPSQTLHRTPVRTRP